MIMLLPSRSKENEKNFDQNQIYHDRPEIRDERSAMRGGAIIMLGPIPIIVGSDSKTTFLLMLLALILTLFGYLMLKVA